MTSAFVLLLLLCRGAKEEKDNSSKTLRPLRRAPWLSTQSSGVQLSWGTGGFARNPSTHTGARQPCTALFSSAEPLVALRRNAPTLQGGKASTAVGPEAYPAVTNECGCRLGPVLPPWSRAVTSATAARALIGRPPAAGSPSPHPAVPVPPHSLPGVLDAPHPGTPCKPHLLSTASMRPGQSSQESRPGKVSGEGEDV